MSTKAPTSNRTQQLGGDEGFLLLGLVVVCFLLLLFLAVAAPRVAKQLERDREVESEHRAEQYVRAIQLFYRRTHRFPTSVEELLGTGTSGGVSSALQVKYLRQAYKDPLTGGEYRLIPVGKAKTEVKGFFGEPLEGAPIGNLGSVAGMASSSGFATPSGASGSSSSGFSLGSSSSMVGPQGATAGSTGIGATTPTTAQSGSNSSDTSTSASTFGGSKVAFLGVGSNAKGPGLVEWNGSQNIEDWEFLYDPRVEALKAKVSLFGGSPAANGSGSLGGLQSSGASAFGGSSSSFGNGLSSSQSGFGTSTQAGQANPGASASADPNASPTR